jgi:hypothetical protein
LSERYAAGDVIVAEATLQPPTADGKRTLNLSVIDYGSGGGQSAKDQITNDSGNIDQLLKDGVDRVASLVQNSWKQENLVDPNQRAQVKVHVPFSSLQQWVDVKRHLAQVSLIKSVNLTNLSRTGADIELTYLGDEVQFVRALNQANLMITNSGEGLQPRTLAAPGTIPQSPGTQSPAPGTDNGGTGNGGINNGGTDDGGDLTQPAAPQ